MPAASPIPAAKEYSPDMAGAIFEKIYRETIATLASDSANGPLVSAICRKAHPRQGGLSVVHEGAHYRLRFYRGADGVLELGLERNSRDNDWEEVQLPANACPFILQINHREGGGERAATPSSIGTRLRFQGIQIDSQVNWITPNGHVALRTAEMTPAGFQQNFNANGGLPFGDAAKRGVDLGNVSIVGDAVRITVRGLNFPISLDGRTRYLAAGQGVVFSMVFGSDSIVAACQTKTPSGESAPHLARARFRDPGFIPRGNRHGELGTQTFTVPCSAYDSGTIRLRLDELSVEL